MRRDDTKLSDTVGAGIETSEEASEESDLGPFGFRVSWIDWDSGFRGAELQIGDRIIGVDDDRYERPQRTDWASHAIGGWAEPQYWEKRRGRDGTEVTLHVWRKGKTLQIPGSLRAERFYYTEDKKAALAPGGPPRLGNDGFSSAWTTWYEARVKEATRVLDGGWRRGTLDSRMFLASHLEEKPRVDYLVAHYPGPFADAVLQDWQRVHDVLLGPERKITTADLDYRTLGEQRAAMIAKVAVDARQDFVARHQKDTLAVSDFPRAESAYADAKSSLDTFVSGAGTSGLSSDGAELRVDLMEKLAGHLKAAADVYGAFVKQHKTKFFGALGPDIKKELVEPDAWRQYASWVTGYGLDAKVRAWQDSATNYFGVDLSRLPSNARDQLKTGLRAVIDDLIESMTAAGKTFRDVKVVIEDEREVVEEELEN